MAREGAGSADGAGSEDSEAKGFLAMTAFFKKKKHVGALKTLVLPAAVYLILLVCTRGRFGQPATVLMAFRLSVISILIAMALGFSMTMGMWDFSSGAVVLFAALAGAHVSKATGTGAFGMVLACIALAVACAAATGLLYNVIKVPSIVLTVGLAMCYESLPRMLSVSRVQINVKDAVLARTPWCFIILGVMFAVFYVLLNKTAFGYNVKAIGAAQTIAGSSGVSLARTKFCSFLFGGFFLGVAAFLHISNSSALSAPSSFSSVTLIFNSMMGVFIAFFLQRYCNFAVGLVVGSVSMTMLTSGLIALGLDTTMRNITSGLFLLALLIFSSNQGLLDDMRRRRGLVRAADERFALAQGGGGQGPGAQ
jgi:ribose transport system permease protein